MKPLILIFMVTLILCSGASAFEIRGENVSISYDRETVLESFNDHLFLGQLRYLLRGRRALTIEDDVINKINVISERVQEVLDMYPSRLQYSMTLLETSKQVEETYLSLHGSRWKRPAFYSPKADTVFLNADTSTLKIVAHEIGHVVVEKYFQVKPPVKVHELLAQYAEKHIGD